MWRVRGVVYHELLEDILDTTNTLKMEEEYDVQKKYHRLRNAKCAKCRQSIAEE